MKQTSADYTFGIASLEIVLLLLGSFLLGMLLCWLLRKLGICCAVRKTEPEYRRASLSTPSTTQEGGRTPRKFPGEELKGGGYTADINSLLRTRDPVTPPASRTPDTSAAGITTAAVTASVTSRAGMGGTIGHKDDLKKLEGIGPKIEQVLNAAGIYNFAQLASMAPDEIKPVLEEAGNQFKMHDPKSWPYQAELANKGEWERLKEYQSLLIGGSI